VNTHLWGWACKHIQLMVERTRASPPVCRSKKYVESPAQKFGARVVGYVPVPNALPPLPPPPPTPPSPYLESSY
jgi:hypothetical protein